MEQIIEVLLKRLSHRGVSPDEVPWLIRDVLNAVGGAGEPGVNMVNQRLSILGWNEGILDEVSLALIVCLAEEGDQGFAEDHVSS
jgi:hypothetical protein